MTTNNMLLAAMIVVTLVSIFFAWDELRVTKKNAAQWKERHHKLWREKNLSNETPKKNMKTLDQLIAETKGKFFSVTFTKKDGSVRTINGKDMYRRLMAGGKFAASEAGYVPFVNRNASNILNKKGGNWVCAHKDEVINFKCGKITAEFSNI
jgi:hypothetical protein